jgi:hypothetical protein
MIKPICIGGDWLNEFGTLDFPEPVVLYSCVGRTEDAVKNAKHVLCVFSEPEPLRPRDQWVINNAHRFDLILTHSHRVFNNVRNAAEFNFGSCWIDPKDYVGQGAEKRFVVSFLCGGKTMLQGHHDRIALWQRLGELDIPVDAWASSVCRPPARPQGQEFPCSQWVINNAHLLDSFQTDKIRMLRDAQFHVCIENHREPGYFTEKLIDCFVTRTVPIYVGDPRIGRCFDPAGLFQCATVDEVIETVNRLKPTTYDTVRKAIDCNHNVALGYAERMENRVQRIIDRRLFGKG